MNAKTIREERAGLVSQMNELAATVSAESRNFTAEETEKFDKLDAAQKEMLERAETLERVESVPTIQAVKEDRSYRNYAAPTRQDCNNAVKAFLSQGNPKSRMRDEYRNAADKCGVNLNSNWFTIELDAEARAFGDNPQTVTTSGGGYTIQNAAMQPLEVALKAFGGMRRVAKVIRTDGDGTLPIPTVNDTGNVGRLLSINTQVTDTPIAFGQKTLGAYKYSSDLILCPTELLEDTSVNIVEYVGYALGERLGRITNTHFTTGDGSSKPRGLMADTSAGKTAASATAITWEELFIDLPHSVDYAYRSAPGVGFMMHDTTLAAVKKLVDDNGRPVWQPSLVTGAPDTICGYPVYVNNDMATIAASAKVCAFGDFSKFYIRDVRNVAIKRLDERFADYDQVAFVGFYRGDSALIFSSGSVPVKHLVMAAS